MGGKSAREKEPFTALALSLVFSSLSFFPFAQHYTTPSLYLFSPLYFVYIGDRAASSGSSSSPGFFSSGFFPSALAEGGIIAPSALARARSELPVASAATMPE